MQFMKVNLCDLGLGNGHLKNSNEKINKEIWLQNLKVCASKKEAKKTGRWEEIFANHIYKGLLSEYNNTLHESKQ